jgi:hypothetical protein
MSNSAIGGIEEVMFAFSILFKENRIYFIFIVITLLLLALINE